MRCELLKDERVETQIGLFECSCWIERQSETEAKLFLSCRLQEAENESFQFSIALTESYDTVRDIILIGGGYLLSTMSCVLSTLKGDCKKHFEDCKDKAGDEFWNCLKSKGSGISKDVRNAMIACAIFKN